MRSVFRIVFGSIILQMKQSLQRETYRFCLLIQPIIYVVLMYALFTVSTAVNFMSFVVLGTGMLTLWSTIAFSTAGDLNRERKMGTLVNLFLSPTDFRLVIFSKALGNTVLGLLPTIVLIIFTAIFKREFFVVTHVGLFVFGMFLAIFSFFAMSLMFSAVFALSRKTQLFMNCLEYPVYILCGVLFPISLLPTPFHYVSGILAPTWAIQLLQGAIEGITDYSVFMKQVVILIVLSVLYLICAYALLGIVKKRVRITASLEVY